MTTLDRWLLWSAALAIAACVAVGGWAISSRPEVAPWMECLEGRVRDERAVAKDPAPTSHALEKFQRNWEVRAGTTSAGGASFYIIPQVRISAPPPPVGAALAIAPAAVIDPASLKGELGRTELSWSLSDPPLRLEPHEARSRAEVKALVIERRRGDGAFEPVARLDGKARSFTDTSVEPTRTYSYRVVVESAADRACGSCDRPIPGTGTAEESPEVRLPLPWRFRLLGGDAKVAIVRVETWEKGAWGAKQHTVRPGQRVGTTGFSLITLRFEKSTLVADLADGASGDVLELTTKE